MKINSINIISFGKLKNVKLDFSDSLNIIYGDNEAGKTHIAEFIKVMFYGSGSRGQGVNNLRKRYKPWDGSKMGGSIDFTHNGRRLRIERELKASNAADTVTLRDLDLGTSKSLSGSDNIGAEFFGMSVSAFEQSVFIDNSVVFSGRGDDGELNLKLSNIMASADEDISYDRVVKNITNAKDTLISKNGKKGPIPELEAEVLSLNEQLKKSAYIYKTAADKSAELKITEVEAATAAEEKSRLFERIKLYELYSLKQKLTEFKTAVTDYEQTEALLRLKDGTVADISYLENTEASIESLKNKINLLSEKLRESEGDTAAIAELASTMPSDSSILIALRDKKQELTAQLETVEKSIADTAARLNMLKTERSSLKGKPNKAFIITGALLTAAGVIAGFFITPLFALAAAGVLTAILGFVTKSKPDFTAIDNKISSSEQALQTLQNKKDSVKSGISTTDDEINSYIVKTNTNNSLLESKKQAALEKRTELIRLQEETEREKAEVFNTVCSFKPVYDIPCAEVAIAELKALLARLNEAKIRADIAVSHTGCRSTSEAFKKLEALPDIPEITETRDQLDEAFHNASNRHTELQSRITAMSAEIKALTSGVRTPAEYEREINDKLARLNSMREFTECADLAASVLYEAYSLQRRSFSGALENRAMQIFSGLTGSAYSDMSVSKDFEINVKAAEDITSHGVEFLSKGTVHQAYFALRLALSEFLSEQSGSLPVILDDVFSQYDAERTTAGFKFLTEYSSNNQVLFFTCHKELTDNPNANLIRL